MTSSFICPSPLVSFSSYPAHTQTFEVYPDTWCALPCPTLDFSKSNWTRMKQTLSIMILISFLSSGGVLFSHLIDWTKIEKNYYRIMFSIGFFSYSLIIGMFMILNRNDELICQSDAHYIPKNGFCLFQAASTIWFLTWTEVWLFNLVYDLYRRVADSGEDILSQRLRLKRCTIAGLIVPTVITAIPCFGQNIGFDYEANIPICLYLVSDTPDYFWYSFMIPLYALLVASMITMIMTAWRIHRIFINSKHYEIALSGDREIVPQYNFNTTDTATSTSALPPPLAGSHNSAVAHVSSPTAAGAERRRPKERKQQDGDEEKDVEEEEEEDVENSLHFSEGNRNSFDCNVSYNCRESEISNTNSDRQSIVSRPPPVNDPVAALKAISHSIRESNNNNNENGGFDNSGALLMGGSYSFTNVVGNNNDALESSSEDHESWLGRESASLFSVDLDERKHQQGDLQQAQQEQRGSSSHHKSYSVRQRLRRNLALGKSKLAYLRAIWVYHRRSVAFVIIFTVMAFCLMYYIYQLFYKEFDEYVDSAEIFTACLVGASFNSPNRTQAGVEAYAKASCPSYPFPEKVPNRIEVTFVIGWIAAYAVIPSIILGFNGKLRLLFRTMCRRSQLSSIYQDPSDTTGIKQKLLASSVEQ